MHRHATDADVPAGDEAVLDREVDEVTENYRLALPASTFVGYRCGSGRGRVAVALRDKVTNLIDFPEQGDDA